MIINFTLLIVASSIDNEKYLVQIKVIKFFRSYLKENVNLIILCVIIRKKPREQL